MDAFLISAGVGSWFGFTGPLIIWVFAHGMNSLAPLAKSSQKYSVFVATLRITIWAFSLFGLFGFAAFQGQLSPSKNISGAFLFVGAAVFYSLLYFYRKLEKLVVTST